MAINWGALQPIQPPSVIANVPASPGNANTLASGIMSGLQQGQQMQATAQEMQARGQQMDQNKQLFPSMLQEQQNKAESSSMDLQAKKQSFQDAASLRAAAKEGEASYLKAVEQVDPALKYQFLKSKADYNKVLADIADKNADTKAKNMIVQQQTAGALSGIADAAHNAEMKKPGAGQKVFSILMSQLDPDTQKSLIKAGLGEFNNNTNMILQTTGMEAMASIKEASDRKDAPELVKYQGQRDSLQQKVDSGNATPAEQRNLEELNRAIAAKGRGAQNVLNPSQQVNIATTTDRLKETGKQATTAAAAITNFNQMEKLNDSAYAGQGSELKLKAKQFLDFMGVPTQKGVSETEAFNSIVRSAQLNAQQLLKGSSSDRDMEIVAQTSPQLFNTKNGRALMISAGKYKATMDQQYNSFLNSWQNKNDGSLDGADEAWNQYIQNRNDYNPKTMKFDSKAVNKQSWTPFLDPNYKAPTNTNSASESGYSQDAVQAEMKRRGLL